MFIQYVWIFSDDRDLIWIMTELWGSGFSWTKHPSLAVTDFTSHAYFFADLQNMIMLFPKVEQVGWKSKVQIILLSSGCH